MTIFGLDYQQFWTVFVAAVVVGIVGFFVLGCLVVWILAMLVGVVRGFLERIERIERVRYLDEDEVR